MAKNTLQEDSLSSSEKIVDILEYNSIATAHPSKCPQKPGDD